MRLMLLNVDDLPVSEFLWIGAGPPPIVRYLGDFWVLAHPMVIPLEPHLRPSGHPLCRRELIGYHYRPVAVVDLRAAEQMRDAGKVFA